MAEFSYALWLTTFLLRLAVITADNGRNTLYKDLKSTAFDCSMELNDSLWKIHCESDDIKDKSVFFVGNIKGNSTSDSPITLSSLVNTTSDFDSELYTCDSILRSIINIYPSALVEHCTNISNYLKYFVEFLEEKSIKSIQVANAFNVDVFLNIFTELSRLQEVRISNSSFSNLTSLPFRENNNIISLVLTHNQIQVISFQNLTSLKTLDLSSNKIKQLNGSLLNGLPAITTLDVSFNSLERISNDSFVNMELLQNLFLRNNNLKVLDKNIFRQNKLLQILDLSNNNLTEMRPEMFQFLPELTNISCSNCGISVLDQNLFKGSPKLQDVELSQNNIESIPEGLFTNSKFLSAVNLGFNKLEKLSKTTFECHPYLRRLNLTQNFISSLEKGVFDGAPHIYLLDLNGNKLKILTDEHVSNFKDLEWFLLEDNNIEMIELGMIENVLIRRLLISNNSISTLNIQWKKLTYLEAFYADNNQLTKLDIPPCIPSVKQTITFSFRNNSISTVKLDTLIEDETRVETDRTMTGCFFNGLAKNFVDLTDNPLFCDCHLYPFYKYIKEKVPRRFQLDIFLNKDNLTCAAPNSLKHETITHLEDDILSCPIAKQCPIPCNCGVRGKDNMTFVNCSDNNLKTLPKIIPNDTTVLYFNGNKLLSILDLNSRMWENLVEIHLDKNNLVNLDNWNYPENLRYLSLRDNKLKLPPSWFMHFMQNQTTKFRLFFGGNDRNCSCDREEFKDFLIKHSNLVGDVNDIVCEITNNGTTVLLPLVSVPDSVLCTTDELNYGQKRMIISLSLFFTISIIVLLIYYKQRQLILSFLYIHCGILYRLFYSEEEFDEDKIFDAFVAYNSNNRDIVMDLIQELENHPPFFKLCIHERNWLPGQFIYENILNSLHSSRRTIMVLSDSFIASPWFHLELRAAVSKMSKDKVSRIIVVLADKNVSISDIDIELRHVISKRTYLVWKERWFWEKLRYAMPRKKVVVDVNGTVMCRGKATDEFSLIPETA